MLRRIKQALYGLSVIALGLIFFVGFNEEMRQEIPWHREAGIGIVIFGGLLLLALTLRSIMRFVQAILLGAVGAGLTYAAFATPYQDWEWQNYLFVGLALLFALNVPIALLGGYDFQDRNTGLGKEIIEEGTKSGLEEILEE